MNTPLYPLKFHTIFKDKIWGGSKIKDVLKKDFSPLPNCGETWELSGVEGNLSIIRNGELAGKSLTDVINAYKAELVGTKVYERYGRNFPLLVKFIDANDDLSLQVHPNDEQAKQYKSFGKTEMWYIVQADEDATLISGFNRNTSKDEFLKLMENREINEVLNKEKVKVDDYFFIPAGRIHTIGKGILLAEIQQSSDITFRVYDFDRKDAQGNSRELHLKEAADVIDYSANPENESIAPLVKNEVNNIVSSAYFTTNRIYIDQEIHRNFTSLSSFVIYVCIAGTANISYNDNRLEITKGEVVLLPASIDKISLLPKPDCKLLESYIS